MIVCELLAHIYIYLNKWFSFGIVQKLNLQYWKLYQVYKDHIIRIFPAAFLLGEPFFLEHCNILKV